MNKFLILLLLFSCSIVEIKKNTPYNFYIEKLNENDYKIILMNGYIFIGNKELSQGYFKKKDNEPPIYGITKKRGNFEFNNSKPEWCRAGNCINGVGESYYFNELLKDYGFIFKGTFKNLEEFNGKIDYENKTCLYLNNGILTETSLFSELIKKIEKEDFRVLEEERKAKRLSEEAEAMRKRKEIIDFIDKMYTLGARDLHSCIIKCNQYKINYNCNSSCYDAINIYR